MIDLSQNGLSHDQIVENLQSKWLPKMKFEVNLTRNNSPIATFDVHSCSFHCNSEQEVKYGATLEAGYIEVDQNLDMIQMVMFVDDGQRFSFPFVPLRIVSAQKKIQDDVETIYIEAMDSVYALQNDSLGERLFIPKGSSYIGEIDKLIRSRGFPFTNITPSSKVVQFDREEWEISTKTLDVINQLAKEINYRTLEVGIDGIVGLREYRPPDVGEANIKYSTLTNSVIFNEKSVEQDSWGRPNIFIASVFTSEMEKPLFAKFENSNPSDPTSIINNPYRITTILENVNNIADQESLDGSVRRYAEEVSSTFEKAVLHTAIMPHHEISETLTIYSNGIEGVWEETGWSIGNFGAGGKMTHQLRRVFL